MTKYFLCGILFYFSLYSSFGQRSEKRANTDSLASLLKNAREDTNKVKLLTTLADELRNRVSPDSCISLGKKALSLAENLKWKKGIGMSYDALQWYYQLKSDYASALDYNLKALDLWMKLSEESPTGKTALFESKISACYANLGNIYSHKGDTQKGFDYYSIAIQREEKAGNKKSLCVLYGYMGNLYNDRKKNYDKAIEYYRKALNLSEELGRKNVSSFWLANIGSAFISLSTQKGVTACKKDSLQAIALNYYFRAMKITEELDNKREHADILNSIGLLYTANGKFAEAEERLKQSLELSCEIRNYSNIQEAEKALSALYDTMGNIKLAYAHYKKYILARDSLNSEENAEAQARIETKYEQDKKDIAANDDKQRQKLVRNSFIGGFVLVLILALIVLRSYRQKQKANIIITKQKEEVEKQKKIVEEHQKEVIDSIRYARRIQASLLPTEKYIQRILSKK
jgi:two-component system, NtrC family, sensor kinase